MFASIHQDFLDAAERFPQQTAVWSEDAAISYQSLRERACGFARWLLDQQLAPKQRVAIILPKSIEAVVAIFGTLMAGNTYVPLGATWPSNRIEAIEAVGQFSLMLDTSTVNPPTASADTATPIRLGVQSNIWRDITAADASNLPIELAESQLTPESVAYILYTSGSTGVPKGVCVSHSAARAFPHWALDELGVNHNDRIASIAPFTFDLSTFDLFTTLAAGATLFLVPEKHKMLPSKLSLFLQDQGISIMYAVPSTLVLLTLRGQLAARDLSALRTVLFAGEVFLPPAYRAFKALMPTHTEYYNFYGPTETNVCTYYKMPTVDNETDESIPIGLPLPGTRLFTLMNEDDDGGQGELCVAGPTVMSGYWGESGAENLEPRLNHWVAIPDEDYPKAYRTGDMVTQRADGNWLYHGRRDKMVKIWGYRIELGDVETCLLKHEMIEQAAAIKHVKSAQLGEALVAFVVESGDAFDASQDEAQKTKAVIEHCKQHLPHYMVPQQIYWLASMPLNHSGKIDRLHLEKSLQQ